MKNTLYSLLLLFIVSNANAQVYPYNQDFENYASFSPPSDWTYTTAPFNVYPTRGVNGSKGLSRNFFSLSLKDSIISPLIGPITSTALLFDYRIVDYIGGTPLAHPISAGDKIEIKVIDGVNPPVTLLTIDASNHLDSSGFQPITASLSGFGGSNISIMISVTSGGGDFFVDVDNFVVDDLTTAGSLSKKELFSIFPNPASNILKLNSTEKGTLTFYDYSGKILLKKEVTDFNPFDISELPIGTYLVEFVSKNGLKSTKTLTIAR